MAIRFGPFDPLQMIFNVMNALMKKGFLTGEEAKDIVRQSLDPNMSESEKNKIIESVYKEN